MSRLQFERDYEAVLEDIQANEEARGDAPVGFNVTYHIPTRNFGATWEFHIAPIAGFKANIEQIRIYEVTTALSSMNGNLSVGTDADPDAFVDEIALSNVAQGADDIVATRPAHVADIPNTGTAFAVHFARTAGAGVASLAVTVRYFL